jgi:hypothetical protein
VSRTFSSTLLSSLFEQQTNEVLLFLLSIDHADWASPVLLVNDRADIVSNGDTYSSYPFDIQLPAEDPEQLQVQTTIKLSNVDRQVIAALRELQTEPTVTVSLALASTPDTIEYGPANFILSSYDYNAIEITGKLTYEDILSEPIPGDTFNPPDFPGVFG